MSEEQRIAGGSVSDTRDGAVRVPLSNSPEFALVDETDAGLVEGVWSRSPQGYAQMWLEGRVVLMHRLLVGEGAEVDHRNGNGLDNRRANLRPATRAQNNQNRAAPRRRSPTLPQSRFKGVTWDAERGAWRSRITANGKVCRLGRFGSEEDAARAYDEAARLLHGEFAVINFPPRADPGTSKNVAVGQSGE